VSDIQRKTGFIDSFMANNVNIASPDASAKWESMMQFLKNQEEILLETYKYSNQIRQIVSYYTTTNIPDTLFSFSKSLLRLIESAKDIVKDDPVIFDLAKQFAEVAKTSRDRRVVDIAKSIIVDLIDLRKAT